MFTKYEQLNLLCSALEGGSNYWYLLIDLSMLDKSTEGQPLVDRIMDAVSKGAKIPVHDLENEEEPLGYITKEGLEKASILMFEKHRRHFADVITENGDASTGDVFFQLAVMEDVVYG
jgi:hypothetical protein